MLIGCVIAKDDLMRRKKLNIHGIMGGNDDWYDEELGSFGKIFIK